ncbi:SRPBCC domain-containing protein [Caballeronia sp. LZ062]|uniref:CoxG family protein n=1 Tax=unclassified Caballeronia TaxID=2646786 RepID=UPI0028545BC2|nr:MULTISPECIES: SRPBCC domain-containing protein [unclassified Caballeronia]MDR5853730.1 SRPBCC domain-containing protein [Caballeronia sp. LZ050]MDR5871738.1 SRPBCC domain-containing protein [Caballeronia sp. LZ062]
MEVTEALRVPLDPAHVEDALGDLALLRASLDNCESFTRTPAGEYALTLIVPLGALRARYDVRAHAAGRTRQDHLQDDSQDEDDRAYARTLSFKERGEGVGSLRGQIAVALNRGGDGEDSASTWIEYTVWATVSGPLAGLPTRQIENALREGADDFFAEFCEVVRAKHGLPSLRAAGDHPRRHVFLRPGAMSAAFSRRAGATARAVHGAPGDAAPTGVLRHRLGGHPFAHRERHHEHDPHPFGLPGWAWAVMLALVALFAFFAERGSLH